MDNAILTNILQESFLLALLIGSAFAGLIGLLYLISPGVAKTLSLRANRWVSLRRRSRPLEIPHSLDSSFYHYHRWFGLFILISATYILYHFAFEISLNEAGVAFSKYINHSAANWLLEAFLWFIVPMSLLFIVFGATMAIKPSALKRIEKLSNRWISSRKITQPIERQNLFMDGWVERHPRHFGIIVLLGASYTFALLLIFFLKT